MNLSQATVGADTSSIRVANRRLWRLRSFSDRILSLASLLVNTGIGTLQSLRGGVVHDRGWLLTAARHGDGIGIELERRGCEVAAHTKAAFIFLLCIFPSWPDLLSAFALRLAALRLVDPDPGG